MPFFNNNGEEIAPPTDGGNAPTPVPGLGARPSILDQADLPAAEVSAEAAVSDSLPEPLPSVDPNNTPPAEVNDVEVEP